MRKIFWCWLLAVLLSGPDIARAQDVQVADKSPEYLAAYKLLNDSLPALYRYERAGQRVAVERVATYLLARYPGRVAFVPSNTSPKRTQYLFSTEYPQRAYAGRAQMRQQRDELRGATADFAQALRYGELAYRTPDTYHSYLHPSDAFLRDTYYARAIYRFDQLHEQAGGCQDLSQSYQLDTLRASNVRWRGCVMPATRAVLTSSDRERAGRIVLDSLALAQKLINRLRLPRAEQLLRQLDAGNAGPFVRVPPVDELRYLRSQLARQRGDYRRAVAYLDTLLPNNVNYTGTTRYRYARGILRIDHLKDRASGCEDLRWVYDHDTSSTKTTHPRWRGCPLPVRKIPIGQTEVNAHRAAFLDSVARATALCKAGRGDLGLPIFARLLSTGEAGAYAPDIQYYQRPGQRMRAYPQLTYSYLYITLRDARAQAYQDLRDYPNAVAELDTLIKNHDNTSKRNTDWHCRRGALLADQLHDQARACQDLTECSRRGGRPPGDKPWRNCDIKEQRVSYRLGHTGAIYTLFGNLYTTTPRAGYFHQGSAHGAEVGLQWSERGEGYGNYGPSIGFEAALNPVGNRDFLFAPKLSYEAEALFVGGRLDLAYYLGTANGRNIGDLRLTPQIGGSLLALLNVFYGYAIPIAGTEATFLGRHRLSIYWNFLKLGKIGG